MGKGNSWPRKIRRTCAGFYADSMVVDGCPEMTPRSDEDVVLCVMKAELKMQGRATG